MTASCALRDRLTSVSPNDKRAYLRPGICFPSCRAVGGRTERALASASALELFHGAFLVNDDLENASEFRRGRATMLKEQGVRGAINVGDDRAHRSGTRFLNVAYPDGQQRTFAGQAVEHMADGLRDRPVRRLRGAWQPSPPTARHPPHGAPPAASGRRTRPLRDSPPGDELRGTGAYRRNGGPAARLGRIALKWR